VTARWVMTAYNGQNAMRATHSSWARVASLSFLCCAILASSSRMSLGVDLARAMSGSCGRPMEDFVGLTDCCRYSYGIVTYSSADAFTPKHDATATKSPLAIDTTV
jgi:hypothetical protein